MPFFFPVPGTHTMKLNVSLFPLIRVHHVCLLSSLQSEMVKYQKWSRSYKASENPVFLIPFPSEIRRLLAWFLGHRYYSPVWELWASPRSVRGRLCVSMGYQGRTASLLAPVAASSLHVEITILFLFLTAHSISTCIVPDSQTVVCVSVVWNSHSWV